MKTLLNRVWSMHYGGDECEEGEDCDGMGWDGMGRGGGQKKLGCIGARIAHEQ